MLNDLTRSLRSATTLPPIPLLLVRRWRRAVTLWKATQVRPFSIIPLRHSIPPYQQSPALFSQYRFNLSCTQIWSRRVLTVGRLCLPTEATVESDLPYPIYLSQAFLMSGVTLSFHIWDHRMNCGSILVNTFSSKTSHGQKHFEKHCFWVQFQQSILSPCTVQLQLQFLHYWRTIGSLYTSYHNQFFNIHRRYG